MRLTRKLLYFYSKYLKLSVRLKLFLTLVVLFLIPFIVTTYVLLSNQYSIILDNIYNQSLGRVKIVGYDLGDKLAKTISFSKDNPHYLNEGSVETLFDLPIKDKDLLELHLETAEGTSVLFIFKQDGLRLIYSLYRNQKWKYYIFKGDFIADLLLDNDNITENDTFFLYSLNNEPLASNLIEENFQVPEKWVRVLNSETVFDQVRNVTVANTNHYLLSSRLPNLPMVAIVIIAEKNLVAPLRQAIWQQVYILLGIVFLAFLFATMLARRQMQPLRSILTQMKKISQHDYSYRLRIAANDERRTIFRLLNRIQAKLRRFHEINVEKIIRHEAQLNAELEYAARVQKLFLPRQVKEITGLEYSFRYIPYIEVGGDYFDIIETDHHVFFALGDVTGHGIQASLTMTIIKVLFNQAVRIGNEAETILKKFNQAICEQLPGLNILPFIFFMYEKAGEQRLWLSNSGSPAIIRATKQGTFFFEERNTAVGIMPDLKPNIVEIKPAAGEFFFAYSDGATDVINGRQEEFDYDRLLNYFQKNVELPPEEMSQGLENTLRQYAGGTPYPDDITWIFLRFK